MFLGRKFVTAITAVVIAVSCTGIVAAEPSRDAALVNRGVVEMEISGLGGMPAQMTRDIVSVVDDGATRRVVPVIGKGPLQNLTDLKYLRGIDLAVVQADTLDYAREQRILPGIESSTSFITRLHNSELHLLADTRVRNVADLAGQTVNVDLHGSGTELTAGRLFNLLGVHVVTANDSQEVALDKLRAGKIAALALVGAKPAPILQGIKSNEEFHLLSIPLTDAVAASYAPAQITSADYPGLVQGKSVDTIAVGNVLMAADLRMLPERYRNVQNFVQALFDGFPTLQEPGHSPKWQDINIAANFPRLQRHPQAAQWLERNLPVASAPNSDAMKNLFSQFIDERRQASGGEPMSAAEKDALFEQFWSWQRGQAR